MFTMEQLDDVHDRLGSMENLAAYVRALNAIGVDRSVSYLSDGHSEYLSQDGRSVVSETVHEVLSISVVGDRETVAEHLNLHQRGLTDYLEMSRRVSPRAGWRRGLSTRAR